MRIDDLKRTVDLRDYAYKYHGLAANSKGLAKCPWHNDTRPSLSINQKDGEWVWYCHSCQIGGSIIELEAKCGNVDKKTAIARLMEIFDPNHGKAAGDHPHPGEGDGENGILATYGYRDEHGMLLFQVVRKPNKEFPVRRPDGAGGWSWGLGDTRRVLFHLPELIAGIEVGATAYLVEGEKDVLALEAIGLVATTNPGGAGKWRDEYSTVFPKGSRAVVIPDNDEPGKKHARQVYDSLRKAGIKVRTFELPGLKDKGDISDWLEEHDAQGPDESRELLDGLVEESERREGAITVEELAIMAIPEIDWLVRPIVERYGFTLIGGMKGIGKSLFLTQLALAAANDEPAVFLDDTITIPRPVKVLLIQQEVSLPGMKDRLRKMTLEERFVVGDRVRLKTTTGNWWDLGDQVGRDKLIRLVEEYEPDLLALDPLYSFWTKELNTAGDVSGLLETIGDLKTNYNLGVALVHHFSNKPTGDEIENVTTVGRFMGSSLIANCADSTVALDFLHPRYKNADLPLPWQNYAKIEISCRHGEWLPLFAIERQRNCLLFRKSEVLKDLGRMVFPERIVELLREKGGGEISQREVLEKMRPASERTIRRSIQEAANRGWVAIVRDEARPGRPAIIQLIDPK